MTTQTGMTLKQIARMRFYSALENYREALRSKSHDRNAKRFLAELELRDTVVNMALANCEADIGAGKYDNWEAKPMPPLGKIREV